MLLVLNATLVWAKDEEPAAAPPSTPFFLSHVLVILFIALGILAVVRSTVSAPGDDN